MSWADDQMRGALERLLDAAGDDGARFILGEVGTAAARAELERVIACRLAMRLLEASVERWAIRERLVSRGLSERSAYRAITAALQAGPRSSAKNPPELAGETVTMSASQPSPGTPDANH